jgi:hypothetical protein
MTFYQDTLINGVKIEKVLKTGRVKELTNTQRDSIDQLVTEAETLTGQYLERATNEHTMIYLDRVIRRWRQDSLEKETARTRFIKLLQFSLDRRLWITVILPGNFSRSSNTKTY